MAVISIHLGYVECIYCHLKQRSANRKDMKIRHLTRCEKFQSYYARTQGILDPIGIKKLAQELCNISFSTVSD